MLWARTMLGTLIIFSSLPFIIQGANLKASIYGPKEEHIRVKRASKCYDDIGCFSNDPPFDNTPRVPQSPTDCGIEFFLYTRSNPTSEHHLVAGDRTSILSSNFQSNLDTKFLIHGFTSDGKTSWVKDMTQALLERESMNVIAVDWKEGAKMSNYNQASSNTRVVGAELARLITFLNEVVGTSNRQYHIIGHSLGSHAAGYAGERLSGLGRITGLDPAEPNFEHEDPVVRLDTDDAVFVDVIHTDGEPFSDLGWGLDQPVGDIDFYPNGGQNQPGCGTLQLTCSHGRAIDYFIESINSACEFASYPCPNKEQWFADKCLSCGSTGCPVMGYDANRYSNRGTYYLSTRGSSPYCGY